MTYKPSDDEIKELFDSEIWPNLTAGNPQPENTPCLYALGGQPGAGKSKLEEKIAGKHGNNLVSINGDEFREYHPDFDAIQAEHGANAALHTAEFSGAITGLALERAAVEGLSVMVEGTFRTSETPINTLEAFKDQGYDTTAMIATCPKDISWSSTLERYSTMEQHGSTPRYTPKPAHDVVIDSLAENADAVLQSGQADHVLVFSRTEQLFNSDTDDNERLQQSINDEIHRPLTQEEHEKVLDNYQAMEQAQEGLQAPRAEVAATERQKLAYVLESQDQNEIEKYPGLASVQDDIQRMARNKTAEDLNKLIKKRSKQIESGTRRISNDRDKGLDISR